MMAIRIRSAFQYDGVSHDEVDARISAFYYLAEAFLNNHQGCRHKTLRYTLEGRGSFVTCVPAGFPEGGKYPRTMHELILRSDGGYDMGG